ncbi:MAG: transposase [Chitinophagales bacterium]
MVRQARQRCESGIYHIVLRGINRGDIFYDEYDMLRFLETLARKKEDDEYELHGYCLMSNHIHLLVREFGDPVSRIMSRIGTSYAKWYNQKYDRSGHVFQGRYGSECIKDDKYLFTVIRYIHNNPVKSGMVSEAEAYRWSSIHAYYGDREYPSGLTKTDLILNIIHQNRISAIMTFREFMKQENEDKCLDDEAKFKKTDGEVKAEIEALMDGELIGKLHGQEKAKRDAILRTIKMSEGVTLRQIARVTGLSLTNVHRA